MRTVERRFPASSVMTISCVHSVRPRESARQVPVTQPRSTERECVALISMPTGNFVAPPCTAEDRLPSDSPSTTCAPPWRIPIVCVLPLTGIRATE